MRAKIDAFLTLTRRSAPPSPEGRGTRPYMTAELKSAPHKRLSRQQGRNLDNGDHRPSLQYTGCPADGVMNVLQLGDRVRVEHEWIRIGQPEAPVEIIQRIGQRKPAVDQGLERMLY